MKNLWNKKLFAEGLRQIRTLTVVLAIIFSLYGILVTIGISITNAGIQYEEYTYNIINSDNASISVPDITPTVCTGLTLDGGLIGLMYIAAPLITLAMFSFLNARNTSDFYHSIPHKRITIFISFFTAVITSLLIITASSVVATIITATICSRYVALTISSLLILALSCFIGAVLVSSAVALVMTVTGTNFNNILISVALLFAPRMLITVFVETVGSSLPMVNASKFVPLASASYNLPAGLPITLVTKGSSQVTEMLGSPATMFYSFALALIYAVLAAVLFVHRKSEFAAVAAPGHKMQTFFRIALTFCFTSLVTLALVMEIKGESYIDTYAFVVLYIICIVFYFVYELITTKKWKNVLKAVPQLLILLVVNLLFAGGTVLFTNMEAGYSPDADKVNAISLVSSDDYSISGDYIGDALDSLSSYMDSQAENIRITDRKAIEILTKALEDEVKTYKDGGNAAFRNKYIYSVVYSQTDVMPEKYGVTAGDVAYEESKVYSYLTVRFYTALGYRDRVVYLTDSDYTSIMYAVEENEEYRRSWQNIPQAISSTVYLECNRYDGIYVGNSEKVDELAECLRTEIAQCDFSTVYDILSGRSNNDYSMYVSYSYTDGAGKKYISVPIFESITPKSFEMAGELVCEQMNDNINEIEEDITAKKDKFGDNTVYEISMNAYTYDVNGNFSGGYIYSNNDILAQNGITFEEAWNALTELCTVIENVNETGEYTPYVSVWMDIYAANSDDSYSYYGYDGYSGSCVLNCPIPYEALRALFGETNYNDYMSEYVTKKDSDITYGEFVEYLKETYCVSANAGN